MLLRSILSHRSVSCTKHLKRNLVHRQHKKISKIEANEGAKYGSYSSLTQLNPLERKLNVRCVTLKQNSSRFDESKFEVALEKYLNDPHLKDNFGTEITSFNILKHCSPQQLTKFLERTKHLLLENSKDNSTSEIVLELLNRVKDSPSDREIFLSSFKNKVFRMCEMENTSLVLTEIVNMLESKDYPFIYDEVFTHFTRLASTLRGSKFIQALYERTVDSEMKKKIAERAKTDKSLDKVYSGKLLLEKVMADLPNSEQMFRSLLNSPSGCIGAMKQLEENNLSFINSLFKLLCAEPHLFINNPKCEKHSLQVAQKLIETISDEQFLQLIEKISKNFIGMCMKKNESTLISYLCPRMGSKFFKQTEELIKGQTKNLSVDVYGSHVLRNLIDSSDKAYGFIIRELFKSIIDLSQHPVAHTVVKELAASRYATKDNDYLSALIQVVNSDFVELSKNKWSSLFLAQIINSINSPQQIEFLGQAFENDDFYPLCFHPHGAKVVNECFSIPPISNKIISKLSPYICEVAIDPVAFKLLKTAYETTPSIDLSPLFSSKNLLHIATNKFGSKVLIDFAGRPKLKQHLSEFTKKNVVPLVSDQYGSALVENVVKHNQELVGDLVDTMEGNIGSIDKKAPHLHGTLLSILSHTGPLHQNRIKQLFAIK
eukprot:TRINITY_DN4140_c0_g1_i2.p1 TRINITY_DN4140_c0_g1~~TRINITY_DN4140_c0_g1_i2.p1  ORF type:complete len:658 (-),score=162.90 TRINITY_DN4140_c0_g1_i2:34-2007(-)